MESDPRPSWRQPFGPFDADADADAGARGRRVPTDSTLTFHPPPTTNDTTNDNSLDLSLQPLDDATLDLYPTEDIPSYRALDVVAFTQDFSYWDLDLLNCPLPQQHIEALLPFTHIPDEEIYQSSQTASATYPPPPAQVPPETIRALEQDHGPTRHPAKPYRCTICLDSRPPYQNRDDWRKHEKSHEETYKCQLRGPEKYSATSADTSRAGQSAVCSSSCKRRDGMVAHLRKSHGFKDVKEARELANTYRTSTGKNFWSCGFCIKLFESFKDRLGHLSKHFEQSLSQSQLPGQWQLTTEIQGLLSQPGVRQAWSHLLWALHGGTQPELWWPESIYAEQLKENLQLGQFNVQSAQQIAEAAYVATKSPPHASGSITDLRQPFHSPADGGYPTDFDGSYSLAATNSVAPLGGDISRPAADSVDVEESSQYIEDLERMVLESGRPLSAPNGSC